MTSKGSAELKYRRKANKKLINFEAPCFDALHRTGARRMVTWLRVESPSSLLAVAVETVSLVGASLGGSSVVGVGWEESVRQGTFRCLNVTLGVKNGSIVLIYDSTCAVLALQFGGRSLILSSGGRRNRQNWGGKRDLAFVTQRSWWFQNVCKIKCKSKANTSWVSKKCAFVPDATCHF